MSKLRDYIIQALRMQSERLCTVESVVELSAIASGHAIAEVEQQCLQVWEEAGFA